MKRYEIIREGLEVSDIAFLIFHKFCRNSACDSCPITREKCDSIYTELAHNLYSGTEPTTLDVVKYWLNENVITEQEQMFNEFWTVWPKKVAKEEAKKAFKKLKCTRVLLDKIINAVEIEKRTEQWKKQKGAYIPHASTWLNGKRWEDVHEAETIVTAAVPSYSHERLRSKFNQF